LRAHRDAPWSEPVREAREALRRGALVAALRALAKATAAGAPDAIRREAEWLERRYFKSISVSEQTGQVDVVPLPLLDGDKVAGALERWSRPLFKPWIAVASGVLAIVA